MNPTRGSDHGNTSVRPAGLAAVDPGLLRLAGPVHLDPDATPCVLLVHNEMAVLPELLDHYRRCGPVSFLVVEDRSTDATPAFLAAQPDVTVFHPAAGTATAPTSAAGAVRSSTPSPRADGRSSPTPTNSSIIPASSTAASPLSSPTSTARGPRRSTPPWSTCMPTARLQTTSMRGGGLLDAFPLFDGPDSYRLLASPTRFAAGYPSPRALVFGGLRERLFNRRADPTPFQSWLLRHFARLDGSFTPGALSRQLSALTRRATKRLWTEALVCSKVPLVKWRRGLRFSGGVHAVSRPLRLSDRSAVLLHFKFTAARKGWPTSPNAANMLGGADHYRQMVAQQAVIGRSPVGPPTRRFDGTGAFGPLLR